MRQLVERGVVVAARTQGVHQFRQARRVADLARDRRAVEVGAEADAVDAEEDERFGDARGDELPPELQTAQGRRGWLREAKRRLDERRAAEARPIPRSRPDRLKEGKRAWRKSTGSSVAPTRPTRATARAG